MGIYWGLIISSDTETNTSSDTYAKVKEIEIAKGGILTIKFDMNTNNGDYPSYGRIYVNGVAAGTERITDSTDYVTYTENISGLVAGDLVQLYCKHPTGGAGDNTFVRNFRFYADKLEVATVIQDVA